MVDFETSIVKDVKNGRKMRFNYVMFHVISHELVKAVTKEDGTHTTPSTESVNCFADDFVPTYHPDYHLIPNLPQLPHNLQAPTITANLVTFNML